MKKIPSYIQLLAQKQSLKSTMRHKIGSVIYNKHGVINTGYNRWLSIGNSSYKTRYSIHSEIDCLTGCSLDELWGSSIYIHRSNGGLAKPCKHCMASLISNGIAHIYWSGYANENSNTNL